MGLNNLFLINYIHKVPIRVKCRTIILLDKLQA